MDELAKTDSKRSSEGRTFCSQERGRQEMTRRVVHSEEMKRRAVDGEEMKRRAVHAEMKVGSRLLPVSATACVS